MFHHIVSVSSVCLLLAFAGWDAEERAIFDETIFDPSAFEDYNRQNDMDNAWIWPLDFFSPYRDMYSRQGTSLGCAKRHRKKIKDMGYFYWIIYKTLYTIEDFGVIVDSLALGNGVWLLSTTAVHVTLYFLHTHGWKGLLMSQPNTREATCQVNSNHLSRTMKQMKAKHRAEIEEMARTIEYLQKERIQQKQNLKEQDVAVETLQNAIRHLYHAHAEGDTANPPDDHKKHTAIMDD